MGFIGDVIGSVVGGITGATKSAKGVAQAGQLQATAADKAMAETRAARDEARTLQQPFVNAGTSSLAQQMSLIGLNGTTGQQDAINALIASPEYSTSVRQGEEGILANAAATGGLRGGNTQNSLANFRSDLVGSLINKQYDRLGGITSLGQNAAAGVGNAGMASASQLSSLYGAQASALGAGQMAKGNVNATAFNNALQIAGAVKGF